MREPGRCIRSCIVAVAHQCETIDVARARPLASIVIVSEPARATLSSRLPPSTTTDLHALDPEFVKSGQQLIDGGRFIQDRDDDAEPQRFRHADDPSEAQTAAVMPWVGSSASALQDVGGCRSCKASSDDTTEAQGHR